MATTVSDQLYLRALKQFPSLRKRGLTPAVLRSYGVFVTDTLQLVIPLHDPYGEFVGILIRTVKSDLKYVSQPPDAKKYLYNLSYADSCDDVVVLFESAFDVMATSGFLRGALLGVKLSEIGLATLQGMGCTRVILALDEDQPGRLAALRLARQLIDVGFSVLIYTGYLRIQLEYFDLRDAVLRLDAGKLLLR